MDSIKPENNGIVVDVEVGIIKDGKYFVAYCPSLELSAYAETARKAMNAFEHAMQDFVEDTAQKGTLEKFLLKLGWTLNKDKYEPPKLSHEDLKYLLSSTRLDKKPLRIPV